MLLPHAHLGTAVYGRVDHVDGVFFVATEFAHVNGVPIAPAVSFVYFAHPGNGPARVPIDLCAKSVLLVYFRALCLCVAAVLGILAIVFYDAPRQELRAWTITLMLSSAAPILIAAGSYLRYFTAARSQRAKTIARQIGLPARIVDQIGAIAAGERVVVPLPVAEMLLEQHASATAVRWSETQSEEQ